MAFLGDIMYQRLKMVFLAPNGLMLAAVKMVLRAELMFVAGHYKVSMDIASWLGIGIPGPSDIPTFLDSSADVIWHTFLANFHMITLAQHQIRAELSCTFLKRVTNSMPIRDVEWMHELIGIVHGDDNT
ncbi:hypothetical protein SUGI_0981940 [Cryptomeria japonica]|nr:hypothetical protein SUGI_0981940 [Cryptomeria japonica]